jgi:cytochrome c
MSHQLYPRFAKFAVRLVLLGAFLFCLYLPYSFFGVLPIFTLSNDYAAEEDAKLEERKAIAPAPAGIADEDLIGPDKVFASAEELAQAKTDFIWCRFCHTVEPDPVHRIGPNLNGIIGRRVGSKEKYFYTRSFRAAADQGVIWNAESLDDFLARPKDLYPGNRMRYDPVEDPAKRARLIKYLKAFAQ